MRGLAVCPDWREQLLRAGCGYSHCSVMDFGPAQPRDGYRRSRGSAAMLSVVQIARPIAPPAPVDRTWGMTNLIAVAPVPRVGAPGAGGIRVRRLCDGPGGDTPACPPTDPDRANVRGSTRSGWRPHQVCAAQQAPSRLCEPGALPGLAAPVLRMPNLHSLVRSGLDKLLR